MKKIICLSILCVVWLLGCVTTNPKDLNEYGYPKYINYNPPFYILNKQKWISKHTYNISYDEK